MLLKHIVNKKHEFRKCYKSTAFSNIRTPDAEDGGEEEDEEEGSVVRRLSSVVRRRPSSKDRKKANLTRGIRKKQI